MKGGIFMARKEDERTLKMKENFIELHDNGNSIAEIAKIYGLDKTTVYHCLQEIAEKSGRTRESLLVAPHSTHLKKCCKMEMLYAINDNLSQLQRLI